jgi:hypothetical protein
VIPSTSSCLLHSVSRHVGSKIGSMPLYDLNNLLIYKTFFTHRHRFGYPLHRQNVKFSGFGRSRGRASLSPSRSGPRIMSLDFSRSMLLRHQFALQPKRPCSNRLEQDYLRLDRHSRVARFARPPRSGFSVSWKQQAMSLHGTKQTSRARRTMSGSEGLTDIPRAHRDFAFCEGLRMPAP